MNLSEQAISILRAGDCEVRAGNLLAVAELVQAGYATVSDYYESIDVRITDTGRRAAASIAAGFAADEDAQEAITEFLETSVKHMVITCGTVGNITDAPPSQPGWYATLHSWDPHEGVFPGAHFWTGSAWLPETSAGILYWPTPFQSEDDAKKYAEDHDPDLK